MSIRKKAIIIGSSLILIAIILGIMFHHNISFILAGIGIVIIGIALLSYINKAN